MLRSADECLMLMTLLGIGQDHVDVEYRTGLCLLLAKLFSLKGDLERKTIFDFC